MNIGCLVYKNIITDENGDQCLDLLQSSYKPGISITLMDIHVVTEKTAMRPDLISIQYYGTPKYIDLICEINNIYNPFSIKEGDVLGIPSVSNDDQLYAIPPSEDSSTVATQFTDTARMGQEDQNRIAALKAKAAGLKGSGSDPIPPNMLPAGVESKTYKNGQIILGSNLT
jgi:hypothetical protein